MRLLQTTRRAAASAFWWVSSLPIFLKLAGMGFLITLFFGAAAFWQIEVGIARTHYQILGETALSVATSLASRLEPKVSSQDMGALDKEVSQTIATFPDVRYIVVQGTGKRILSHGFTFPKEAPPDLVKNGGDLCAACHATLSPKVISTDLLEVPQKLKLSTGEVHVYRRNKGMILEVTVPIGTGGAGSVRLGIGDRILGREVRTIYRSLLLSIALCLLAGPSLSFGLSYLLVRPLHNLLLATNRLRENDFSARAKIYSGDEIGQLAVVFNQMADGLETYRRTVHEKEAARQMLIGKIVQAQEDERKSVARELHDQLGQTLSHVLLRIESSRRQCPSETEGCGLICDEVRGLIDEVRKLAWNVRPSILDDYGLEHALARYVEEVSRRVNFHLDCQCVALPGLPLLPGTVAMPLYRIAQEAITNIIRHAQATEASVILMRRRTEIILIVEDNGRGFDAEGLGGRGAGSLGIMGMQERAMLAGGEFIVDSQPGKGTTLRVTIPLPETEPDSEQTER